VYDQSVEKAIYDNVGTGVFTDDYEDDDGYGSRVGPAKFGFIGVRHGVYRADDNGPAPGKVGYEIRGSPPDEIYPTAVAITNTIVGLSSLADAAIQVPRKTQWGPIKLADLVTAQAAFREVGTDFAPFIARIPDQDYTNAARVTKKLVKHFEESVVKLKGLLKAFLVQRCYECNNDDDFECNEGDFPHVHMAGSTCKAHQAAILARISQCYLSGLETLPKSDGTARAGGEDALFAATFAKMFVKGVDEAFADRSGKVLAPIFNKVVRPACQALFQVVAHKKVA
jgi:hypothetical protein